MNLKNFKLWDIYSDVIEFYCHKEYYGVIPEPKSAQKNLPDWFKSLAPVSGPEEPDHFGDPTMTAKKCLPMLDAMSVGFTIPMAGDVKIRTNHDCSQIEAINPPNISVIEFHKAFQVGGNNKLKNKQGDVIKFVNHWVVKTAPGWSTLFIPPMNVFDSPFTCLSGLVDTDRYPKEVNFPAVWNVPNANITLRAGTPLVTAIPVNRKIFKIFKKNPSIRQMNQNDEDRIGKIHRAQVTRNHVYTEELRAKK